MAHFCKKNANNSEIEEPIFTKFGIKLALYEDRWYTWYHWPRFKGQGEWCSLKCLISLILALPMLKTIVTFDCEHGFS